jgi:predicted RNase H-like HicB family nuclease
MEYTAIFKKQSNGTYFAQCEQVPGAMTQGSTIEEAKENLKEALALVLEVEKDLCKRRNMGEKMVRRKLEMV